MTANLTLRNSGIKNPVLIDVVSGEITPLHWAEGRAETLDALPVRDSILAIADAGYFDWPILPETPSGLTAQTSGSNIILAWQIHGGTSSTTGVERRVGDSGPWERITTQPSRTEFTDAAVPLGGTVCYRVRAINSSGESAYSNIVRVKIGPP